MFFKKLIHEIEISKIVTPEVRCRTPREGESLAALAESIREHGVIEPVVVRKESGGAVTLVCGGRRVAAARLAGLTKIPAVTVEADEVDSQVLAVVENLHREDLSIFEEASAIAILIGLSGMTQEQCARRLSVSQSYVANKLRLLKLAEEEREVILSGGLTERHARALLRLSPGAERLTVARRMVERQMNVAAAEEYVESLVCAESRAAELASAPPRTERRIKLIMKDIRLFYNSIDHAVEVMKKSGVEVVSTREETDIGTKITIMLPKDRQTA